MEERKNLCAMLPVALHARVRQEQEKAGMTLGEYVEAMITEYYDWKDGKIMTGEMRTLAAQIPAELFDRLDRYLKERGIKKKDFLVDIITRALEAAEAAEPVTEASPQDELEEQPEADETGTKIKPPQVKPAGANHCRKRQPTRARVSAFLRPDRDALHWKS